MHFHLGIGLLVAVAVLPIELAFFFQLWAGSHLYIGRGALLHDRSRDFAHRGFSSLAQIQPVDFIPRGRNVSFGG